MTLLASPPVKSRITPDDILKMDGLFELVDGQPVEKHMSALSGKTAGIITAILVPFIRTNRLGDFLVETSFRCFPNDTDQTRRPDLAFIAVARADKVPDEGHVPIAPDLAIEIVSPNDSVYELDDKLIDYKAARIPLIWIVNPQARTVKVFRPSKPIDELTEADQLAGEGILPGFTISVRELFPPAIAKS
jgi:Uma2 family endonuclease